VDSLINTVNLPYNTNIVRIGKKLMRILIVRLSALGDVLQTLPVLGILKATYPDSQIGWLVEADAAPLIEGHALIDQIHISQRKRWSRLLLKPWCWGVVLSEFQALRRDIQRAHYDAAIDFQGLLKSALTLFVTAVPKRIGFACAREGASVFYTHRVPLAKDFFDPAIPILDHFKVLIGALGKPVQEALTPAPLPITPHQKPLIVIAPATLWNSKHWPVENWISLIEQVLQQTDVDIAFIGTSQDMALNQSILAGLTASDRLLNLTGKTSLIELQALLQQASLVIGPDSAPLHIAGALGHAALIGLYGPTGYRRSPPPGEGPRTFFSSEGTLPCQPCDKALCPLGTTECMTRIEPDTVLQEVLKALTIPA